MLNDVNTKSQVTVKSAGCISWAWLLQMVFILLKAIGVTNVATWTWAQVFIPAYVIVGFYVLIILISFIISLFSNRY